MIITKSQLVLFAPSKTVSEVGKIGGDDGGGTETSHPVLACPDLSYECNYTGHSKDETYRNEKSDRAERVEHGDRMVSDSHSGDIDLSVPYPAFSTSTVDGLESRALTARRTPSHQPFMAPVDRLRVARRPCIMQRRTGVSTYVWQGREMLTGRVQDHPDVLLLELHHRKLSVAHLVRRGRQHRGELEHGMQLHALRLQTGESIARHR